MSQNISFTKFGHLPLELRLFIWEYAYNATPRRTIEVIFPPNSVYDKWISITADPLPMNLLAINRESRAFFRSRLINPFSSALLEVPQPTNYGSRRSTSNILIDLSRDTLRISDEWNGVQEWEERERREGRTTLDLPLLYLFLHMFEDGNSETLLNNLVTLEVSCHLDWFFGETLELIRRPGVQHDIGIIKTYPPVLKTLILSNALVLMKTWLVDHHATGSRGLFVTVL